MKYRKKPVVIEAVQYNGSNVCEIEEFIGKELQQTIVDDCGYQADATAPVVGLIIETLEGDMVASPLDYIIKGVKGEFYPCKPDVFKQTYEDAEGEEMLTVSRKRVQEIYAYNEDILSLDPAHSGAILLKKRLQDLFGSKYPTDEEAVAENATTTNVDSSEANVDSLKNDLRFDVGRNVVFHPFKSDSFYNATILEIREHENKPFLLHLEEGENIWAYPMEVQSIAETYPTEPKFNKGDLVVFKNTGKIKVIAGIEADGRYIVTTNDGNSPLWVRASDLQPYNSADPTQPNLAMSAKSATPSREEIRKSRTFPEQMPSDGSDNTDNSDPHQSRNLSQNIANCDKYFDIILKDIFSKERRLNIAATITAGMAAGWYHKSQSGSLNDKCQKIAKITFMLADALIAEADFPTDPLCPAKKGGPDDSDDSAPSDSSENPTLSSTK